VGGAVDPDSGNPCWANFTHNTILTCPKEPVDGVLGPVTVLAHTGEGNCESVVFRGDDMYVGHADGSRKIKRYTRTDGIFQQDFSPTLLSRGTDHIALAADNKTMYYTSENRAVYSYDLETRVTSTFVADTGLYANYGVFYRFQDGHVFVSGDSSTKRYDPKGQLVQTYTYSPAPFVFNFALSLNGQKLFAGDFNSPNIWIVDVETGAGVNTPAFQQPGGYETSGIFGLGGTQPLGVIQRLKRPNFTHGRF
jgi:hypothetical protein